MAKLSDKLYQQLPKKKKNCRFIVHSNWISVFKYGTECRWKKKQEQLIYKID